MSQRDRYRAALEEIARHPLSERNPDGDEQAAHTMQLIARDALKTEDSQASRRSLSELTEDQA